MLALDKVCVWVRVTSLEKDVSELYQANTTATTRTTTKRTAWRTRASQRDSLKGFAVTVETPGGHI